MARSRNFQDRVGYGSTAWDESFGVLSGLLGGVLVIAGALLGRVI